MRGCERIINKRRGKVFFFFPSHLCVRRIPDAEPLDTFFEVEEERDILCPVDVALAWQEDWTLEQLEDALNSSKFKVLRLYFFSFVLLKNCGYVLCVCF